MTAVSAAEPQNAAEVLARIRPTRREEATTLCLRPDLLAAWEEAQQQLAEQRIADGENQRLSSGMSKQTKDLARKVQEIEAEIEATQVRFVLRALTKDQYRAICDQHPPRKGNEFDQFAGHDREAVIDEVVRECIVDPVFDGASWAQFVEVCNPSEWNELKAVANRVNSSVVAAPKSELASQILSRPGASSKRPARGE